MRYSTMRLSVTAFGLLVLCSSLVRAAENAIFKELREKGVPLSNGEFGKLPAPSLADGLNADGQKAAIAKVVSISKINAGFMLGGKTDPWQYSLTDIRGKKDDKKASIGRHVDLYFVAQGKLESVKNEKFMKNQVNKGGNRGTAEFYKPEELKERGLQIIDQKDHKDRYAHVLLPLFNMVEISGTGYGVQTSDKESVLVAFKLDPQFAKDPKYPNEWRPLNRGPAGVAAKGAPQPYDGAGGYVKVTELKDQKTPRVFIEYHLIFDEPYGWFSGAPTLSSKLPQQYENDVRQFRVDLKAFEKQNAAAPQGDQAKK
jgi:hypothetical protein